MSEEAVPEADRLGSAPHPRFSPELFGQDQAQADFLDAWNSGRVHHAWLINGAKGIGKATLAWRIARFVLTQPAQSLLADTDAPATSLASDPQQPLQAQIDALSAPTLRLIRRSYDEKAKRLRKDIIVDEIRHLKASFSMAPADGGWRVVIIDATDDLTVQAANALLKLLEEPPEKTLFLLVCHNKGKVLPTIRSRCRDLRCTPLQEDDLLKALAAAHPESGHPPADLATLSEGSVAQASLLSHDNGLTIYHEILDLFGPTGRLNREKATRLAQSCSGRNAENRYRLVLQLTQIFLSRIVRFAITGKSAQTEASEGEFALFEKLGKDVRSARKWAEYLGPLAGRLSHAQAVNLDPASVILDMLLGIDHLIPAD